MLANARWLLRHPGCLLGLARGASVRDLVLREDLRRLGHPLGIAGARGIAETRLHVGTVERLIRHFGAAPPRTLLDVGAARGSFATAAAIAFPELTVHSFEPLPDEFAVLRRHVERAFHCALGDAEGDATIHVSANPGSSSLARMRTAHVDAFPGTDVVSELTVPVRRLDDVVAEEGLSLDGPLLLKIDVQGAEDRVLRGAPETLAQVDHLVIELSLVELYEDQLLADALVARLAEFGFRHVGTFDEIRSASGELVQTDGLFRRA